MYSKWLKGLLQGDKQDVAKVYITKLYFSKINNGQNTSMYVCIYQNNHIWFYEHEDNYIKTLYPWER